MFNILCLVLLAFAIARLTRLVVDDSIALRFRQWVISRTGEHSGWTTLVHCPWCTGWWLSWLATLAVIPWLTLPLWTIPLVALAMGQAAPMILQASDRLATGGQ